MQCCDPVRQLMGFLSEPEFFEKKNREVGFFCGIFEGLFNLFVIIIIV